MAVVGEQTVVAVAGEQTAAAVEEQTAVVAEAQTVVAELGDCSLQESAGAVGSPLAVFPVVGE